MSQSVTLVVGRDRDRVADRQPHETMRGIGKGRGVMAGLRAQLGAGNAVLQLIASRGRIALATPPLFLEYEELLRRPFGTRRVRKGRRGQAACSLIFNSPCDLSLMCDTEGVERSAPRSRRGLR
jgi:hypothetical protein